MDGLARPIVPPAPVPHATELPLWRRVFEFTRSTLGIWPQSAFEVMVARGRTLGTVQLLVNDPDGVRHVMITAAARYRHPVAMARVLRPIVGNGLLLAEGDSWRKQRRQLAPVFNPASVVALLPHFLAAGEAMTSALLDGVPVQLSRVFEEAALDAVLRALFSRPADDDRRPMAGLHAPDERLQQEAGKSLPHGRALYRLVQSHSDAQDVADVARDGGECGGSALGI